MFIIFTTLQWQEPEVYDSWNFPTAPDYDHFWFDVQNTTIVYHSNNHVIGKNQVDVARLRLAPEITTHAKNKPTTKVFGIVLGYEDEVVKRIVYDRVLN